MITIAYINFWEDPSNSSDNYFTKFILYNIGETTLVKPNENPDILIASVFGDISNVIKYNAKCKIFYYGENLNRFPPYNNDNLLENTFDLIVGFKYTNLDKKLLRFPLWLLYYEFYSTSLYNTNSLNTIDIVSYIESKYIENIKKNKIIFASLIARHDREGQRIKICNELSKYESINSLGKIMYPGDFRNNTPKIGMTAQDKINYISQSIYNICPENSVYEGYFTEKIFQAFEGGTIPIYWAIDLPEKEIINENKYCFCNINNENEIKESIQESIYNVVMNPIKYIEGDIFTNNARNIIQGYYNDLRNNIKIKLGLEIRNIDNNKMNTEKVSIIIPTYNRFKYLLNAIESVINQTYNNIEIIVVNDFSSQKEYYEYDYKSVFGDKFTIIHLEQNSKNKFGFACAGYVRNCGIKKSTGKYIAFLDDDDIWFPNKLELQIKAMKRTGCKMSCTDGLIGKGIYDKNKTYQKYNAEHNYDILQNIYKNKGSKLLENGFPEIWDSDFLNIHNCCICSSVVIEKLVLENINYMKNVINCQEDYNCWMQTLKYTNCVYVNDICFYYDMGHGDGQNY